MSLVGRNVGNYKVIAKIGEGGMGSVYLGEHPMIGKKVAIKTLHSDLASKEDIVARFFTEAKAVNNIAHPNIVDIVDFGKMRDEEEDADVVYFVMEFLDGDGLNTRLKAQGTTPRETIHIIRQCTSALAASHRKHIVHRDLKPENIYLVTRGDDKNYTKLLDFGIAKLTGIEGELSQHKTRTGLVIGTPTYMSPEQCEGRGQVDHRSDVYSLGVVMYEMLTGRVPFVGEGFGEILVAHLTKHPDLPSTVRADVPASLEAIVMHALEKDRTKRFQTMEEFSAALDDPAAHLEAYGSPSGRPDTLVPMPAEPSRRQYTQAQALAVVERERGRETSGVNPAIGPRPTTLSGANGEVGGEADGEGLAPKNRAPLFAVLGVLVMASGGAAAFFGMRHNHNPPVAILQPPPVPLQAPAMVKVLIDSDPHGAKVLRAGQTSPLGETPLVLPLKTSEPDFEVVLELAGYKTETRPVSTQHDREMLVPLTKVVVPPPVLLPVAVTPPPPKAGDVGRHPSHGHRPVALPRLDEGGSDRDGVLPPHF